ncbi:MAG: 50S ribosomal protein L22 [Patescibacteria group bacterium]
MKTAKAILRNLRMAPLKVRLAADMVRGLPIDRAVIQLAMNRKAASLPVKKLIESAAANAVTNHGLKKELLFVWRIFVDEGVTIHRSMPRAQGRATPIRKRASHITVVLAEKDGEKTEMKTKKRK